MTNQSAAVAESAERTWPAPDFLNRAQRLRYELEAAIRVEQPLAQRIAEIQNAAFAKGLPVAVVAGGTDELEKLSDKQVAADLAVSEKRKELRSFLNTERAGFFSLREQAHESLRPEISERFVRVQKAAAELRAALVDLLGAEAESLREEKLIREWNRAVRKFNQTIPAVNVNAIPSATGIDPGESIRSLVEGIIRQDNNIRELCRDFLSREAERREMAAANEEARIAQKEADTNPILHEKPF